MRVYDRGRKRETTSFQSKSAEFSLYIYLGKKIK